jgi:hypothetical protein
MIRRSWPEPGSSKSRRRRGNVETNGMDAPSKAVALGIVACNSRQCWIDFDKRNGKALDAPSERQSYRANTGTEIDGVVACARRGRRCEQDGVMADAMAAARLSQDEPAAED